MRHSWKYYHDVEKQNKFSCTEILQNHGESQLIQDCKECVHCGLRKGISRMKYLPTTTYFKNNEILSVDVLPYTCGSDFLFSEGDFLI